ncbi:conserved hypothetical protein [Paecilomyces variotii No. 5]|uniref:Uncharacterized protein n=1 Tax=Byssochlamys spectabilis (strain No. 5 / NBRC 109023) TaxID=1356009 RepID=V5I4T2_BYSSN|nr:conserved hypothetical protein [Paecilomyces variotii No. 5]
MPGLSLHLLSLNGGTDTKSFLIALRKSPGIKVIVASRPRHFVIRPNTIDSTPLTTNKWDLLVLLDSPHKSIPENLRSAIRNEYRVFVGVPSKLLATYPERDAKLKRDASSIPLTGSLDASKGKESSQNLELSPDLLAFMDRLTKEYDGPVTMLNLLHFIPGGKKNYFQYGQAFVPVAGKRGGDAKIVGNVVKPPAGVTDSRGDSNRPEEEWWNEISIVHYPSIRHFCDMLAGDDYQAINEKYRLAALRDTLLLCTTEFDAEESRAAKL